MDKRVYPESARERYSEIAIISQGVLKNSQKIKTFKGEVIYYCKKEPADVLEQIFSRYNVLSCNGHNFFEANDFYKEEVKKGLRINPIKPVGGIEGRIAELLRLNELKSVENFGDLPDVYMIIANLERESGGPEDYYHLEKGLEKYAKTKREIEPIINVLRRFGR